MQEKIINLLFALHKFNKLNALIVGLISESFQVDAETICKENGITYFL